jgi:ABC-type multidrug transport system ATPase subunit
LPQFSLRVQNLSKHFGTAHIFEKVSFAHEHGILGISGPNGSGKSTLMKCLAGLMRPAAGELEWREGDRALDSSSLKEYIGYAAPYINLYPELSCEENLRFVLQLRGMKIRDSSLENALTKTDINGMAAQPFGKLSTGQQQRLRLAAAIVHQPNILFLDEPGSNLDEKGRRLIKSLAAEFSNSEKLVLIASNNPDELALCDRVYSVEQEAFL